MNSSLAPLAVAVPMVAAALCTILGKHVPRVVLCVIALVAVIFETAACGALAYDAALHGTIIDWFGGWHPHHGVAIGIDFAVDPFGAGLACFSGVLTIAALDPVSRIPEFKVCAVALARVAGAVPAPTRTTTPAKEHA